MNNLKKHIKNVLYNFLTENKNGIFLKGYRGIGKRINVTYGGKSDYGLGIFWTDNLTMAKWFAGLIEYDTNTNRYETISKEGKILEKTLYFKNPYIVNSNDEDYDSFQMYMDEIKNFGGVENYKTYLMENGYDGIILKNNNTNYYEHGVYDIYIEI